MSYYFNITLKERDFEKALEKVREALEKEGFGILSEIDVKDTLRKKIDVDFKPYRILGACNPELAYKALSSEDKIGVFLPCNVVVEENEQGIIEVAAVDPIASMQAVKNETIGDIAREVQEKLKKIIANLH